MKQRFKKLGGWLLLLVIYYFLQIFGVFLQFGEGGLLGILRAWSMYDGVQGWLLMASQVLSLLLIVVYLFTAIEILQRDPYFLRTRQLGFAAAALDTLIRLVNGLAYGFAEFELPMLVLQGVMFLLGVIFVMLYFARSVRVRTYMDTDEYLRLGFLTNKMKGPEPAAGEAENKEKTA